MISMSEDNSSFDVSEDLHRMIQDGREVLQTIIKRLVGKTPQQLDIDTNSQSIMVSYSDTCFEMAFNFQSFYMRFVVLMICVSGC